MTGLPCSGKTTLAKESQKMLDILGHKTHHLDGDVFRSSAVKKLNFSKKTVIKILLTLSKSLKIIKMMATASLPVSFPRIENTAN